MRSLKSKELSVLPYSTPTYFIGKNYLLWKLQEFGLVTMRLGVKQFGAWTEMWVNLHFQPRSYQIAASQC